MGLAEALWDHSGKLKTELSFRAGETIAVYFMNKTKWWWGTIDDRKGWFPSSHVRVSLILWNIQVPCACLYVSDFLCRNSS